MFDRIFVPDEYRAAVSDNAWLQAMLDAERALALSEARAGVIPGDAAEAIAAACNADRFDPATLAERGRAPGNPVEPLVRELAEAVGGDAARYVHWGATSQDILDTAAMLVARDAVDLVAGSLDTVAEECAGLADTHRATPMAGRTLLQQAVPTTFGAKAAAWLAGLLDAREGLAALRDDGFRAQLAGAAGTLAPLEDAGPEVVRLFAEELGLAVPTGPWHTNRVRVAQIGAALDVVAGAAAKIALDVALLAQTEVGEVRIGAGGGSSTMPHKRNPVDSTLAIACARLVHGHASTLTGGLAQEHERALGGWHAEWPSLTGALAYTGGAVSAVGRVLDELEVDSDAMRRNLDLLGGAVMAERISFLLADRLGRREAHELVADAARRAARNGRSLLDELAADDRVELPPGGVRGRLVPRVGGSLRRSVTWALPRGQGGALNLRHRLDGPDDAPVLVLANSLGTTLELWDANVASWTDRLRVLRYDLRGHGGSDVPSGPYTVEELGHDVLDLLDRLELERVSYCGLSLGGATGLWLAANAPERIDRLVVACSSARFGEPEPWLERAELVRAKGVAAVADTVVARWFTPHMRPEVVAAFRAMLVATPAEGYAACCEAVAGWDFRDRLGEISTETLVIAASDDPATPPEHGELIRDGVPSARLVVLDDAAHLANVEQPDAFAALVAAHVSTAPVEEAA